MNSENLPIKSFANYEIQVTVDENLPKGYRNIVIYLFGGLARENGWSKKNLICRLKKKNRILTWIPLGKVQADLQFSETTVEKSTHELKVGERRIRLFPVAGITQWKSHHE